MKKILLSSLTCLLAIGLVSACDLDIDTPDLDEDPTEENVDLDEDNDGEGLDEDGDGTEDDKREEFTIWAPYAVLTSVETLVSEFCEINPEFDETYKVTIEQMGLGDAANSVTREVTKAADLYFFAQDQLSRIIVAGGLSQIPASFQDDIKARNDSISVKSATSGGTLYAYPVTSSNGYFVYYDKSVEGLEEELTREEGARQSELIKIAKENSKTIDFEIANSGWYLASYFMATGCESTWYTDESGTYINYVDTWNSAAGLSALQGAAELMGSGVFKDDEIAGSAFYNNAMLVVSGTWDYTSAKYALGDNFGAAPLWTFDINGDGENSVEEDKTETFHLGSFSGNYLVGVKPQVDADKSAWCHVLANYLTSEEAQLMYSKETNMEWAPCNLNSQNSDEILSNGALQALYAQNEYATIQGQYPNSWWAITITLGFGLEKISTNYSNSDLWALLKEYEESIDKIIHEIPGDYVIVGSLADDAMWSVKPEIGVSKYALYEANADSGTYSVGSDGVVHGKWTVNLELAGSSCYVTSSGGLGTGATGDIELGLLRVCDWGEWTGNWGYSQLTDKTGYYDWNSTSYGGGFDNNIGALPGSYTFIFDYTGSTPAITMTSVS